MTPRALIASLTQDWAFGEHAELAGADVTLPVDLNGQILRSFDLTGARFAHGLSARDARFRGMAWFHQARVDGVLDLSGAVFHSDLRLDGLRCDTLILNYARFEGVLTLDGARITRLEARDCLCLANLSLAGAEVAEMDLAGSDLMGGVWAEGAEIPALTLTDVSIDGRQSGI